MKTPPPKVSLLLLSWKRSENLKRILDLQAHFPILDEILIFHNNPGQAFTYQHPKVQVISSTCDFGLRTRWVLGHLARNECLVFQDDDILLEEPVFQRFAAELAGNAERAYSLQGRNLTGKQRYTFKDSYGEVEMVLTRATCIHRKAIPILIAAEHEFPKSADYYPSVGQQGEDIFLSYCLTGAFGQRHLAIKLPHKNLRSTHAISSRPGHWKKRAAFIRICREAFLPPAEEISLAEFEKLTQHASSETELGNAPALAQTASATAEKLRLVSKLSPGDILMLTAAVRDLHLSHPGKFRTAVETPCPALWENNPYVSDFAADEPDVRTIECHYPIIHESNEGPYHFIHGYRLDLEAQLGVKIRATKFRGDIHFRVDELAWMSMVHEHFTGWDSPFWLICTGGKKDYTAKWWIPEFAQEVVDHFRDRIQFVQFGGVGENHHHPPLSGVINLAGQTDLRMLMRLIYHASGVVCPVTFAMHLAAATPGKPGLPPRKPCVVTAGGREPSTFTAYTNHIYLHANGQLPCCPSGGCWKSRTVALEDGDPKDRQLCVNRVDFNGRKVQRCMHDLVTAADVIRAIERYHVGGALRYFPDGFETVEASWSDRITTQRVSPA